MDKLYMYDSTFLLVPNNLNFIIFCHSLSDHSIKIMECTKEWTHMDCFNEHSSHFICPQMNSFSCHDKIDTMFAKHVATNNNFLHLFIKALILLQSTLE